MIVSDVRPRPDLRVVLLFVSILGFVLAAGAAKAREGIDLVVLVDQSGSMWGHPEYHPRANDRYAHRVGATRAVLHRLAADVEGTPRLHRVSLVDFGDEAEVAWSNLALRHDPANPLALRRLLDVEMPRRIVGKEWINTNTPAAVAAAISELRKMQASKHLADRRRIVLLITDGRPQKPPASLDQMKDKVRRQARDLLAEKGAELWIVGLNDASHYWLEGDGAFWQDVVGDPERTHLAERAVPDLPKGIHRMVDDWLGVEETPPPGPTGSYFAPPYLGGLAFRVTFDKPRDPGTVQITAPDGRRLSRVSGGGPGLPTTEARFTLEDPPPGKYEVESRQGPPLVVPEPHAPEIDRILPADGADLEVETRVVYHLSAGSGRPLVPLADWPLGVRLEVEAPDGETTVVPASFEATGKVIGQWRPETPGVHRLRLVGEVEVDGETHDVFRGAPGASSEVEVSSARPLWLQLEKPSPESGVDAWPWDRFADLRLVLVDATGEKVDPASAVADPARFLEVERLDPSGVAIGEAKPLETGTKGRFEAQIPIEPDWRGSAGLFRLGELHLRVRAETTALPEDLALRGIRLPERVETARVAGDPFTVGPLPIRLARGLILGILLLVAVVGLGVIAYLVMRVVPAWRIRRRDAREGRSVKLRIYDIANDPSGASAQEETAGGGASFTFDGRFRLVIDGQTLIADQLRLTRLDSPGRARARLSYRWRGEKKSRSTLLAAGGGPKTLRVEEVVQGRPVAELIETKTTN